MYFLMTNDVECFQKKFMKLGLQKYWYHESKKTGKPIVFLFHPNECLDIGDKKPFFKPFKKRFIKNASRKESFTKEIVATRRTNNLVEYLFADVIRHKLKLKNLGLVSLKLLDEVLMSAKEYGFEFVTVNEYTKMVSSSN